VGALGIAERVWVRSRRCARALAPRAAARPPPHDAARGSAPTCAPRQRARPRRRICLQQPSPERFQHPPLLLLLGLSAPFQRDTLSATLDPPPPAHFSTLVPASSAPSPLLTSSKGLSFSPSGPDDVLHMAPWLLMFPPMLVATGVLAIAAGARAQAEGTKRGSCLILLLATVSCA
jgi:hypothetical protein